MNLISHEISHKIRRAAGIVGSPLLLCLNLVGQINLPNLLRPIGPSMPAGALQRPAGRVAQEIPVTRSIIRGGALLGPALFPCLTSFSFIF